jgi:hypothetical protein
MNDRSHVVRLVVAVGVVLTAAFVAWSAPIISAPRITDEVMSLAKLDRIKLVVAPGLDTVGLDPKEIRDQWSKRLEKQGIQVVGKRDDSAVTLNVVLILLEDATVPDAKGVVTFAIVEQPATVDRIEKKLVIPTYTTYTARLKASDKITRAAREALDELLNNFLRRVKLTTTLR